MTRYKKAKLQALLNQHVLNSGQTIEFFSGVVDRPDDEESPAPLSHEELLRLLRSKKFRSWSGTVVEPDTHKRPDRTITIVEEKHFAPAELAKAWGVSPETIRIVFRNEPDVLRIGNQDGKSRKYISMKIPESVAKRVHRRLSAVPQ